MDTGGWLMLPRTLKRRYSHTRILHMLSRQILPIAVSVPPSAAWYGKVRGRNVNPKGWTVPSSDDYANLITNAYSVASNSAGSNKLASAPLDFGSTGYYSYYGQMKTDYTDGYFWSRTTYSDASAYILKFDMYSVDPQNYQAYNRGNGYALRCTAK